MPPVHLDQLNLVVRDVEASRLFYARLGLDFGEHRDPLWAAHHVAALAAEGVPVQQAPFDAFWGSRHAVVSDPDGNGVVIMSVPDDAHRSDPPPPE